jgi:multisubunit Na+/H+ antiporter MnhE subunit
MTAPPRPLRSAAEWLVHVALAFAAWMAFTLRVAPNELAVGAVAAAIAGSASLVVWRHNGATFRGAARHVAQAWRLPWASVTGTVQIFGVLARHLAGRPAPSLLLALPIDVGARDDPRDRARRALAVAYLSATPDSVALGIDLERGLLWVHMLRRAAPSTLARNLGVRA